MWDFFGSLQTLLLSTSGKRKLKPFSFPLELGISNCWSVLLFWGLIINVNGVGILDCVSLESTSAFVFLQLITKRAMGWKLLDLYIYIFIHCSNCLERIPTIAAFFCLGVFWVLGPNPRPR